MIDTSFDNINTSSVDHHLAHINPSVVFDKFWTSVFKLHKIIPATVERRSNHTAAVERRSNHTAVEHRRRIKLNEKFYILGLAIPSLRDKPKATKSDILIAAAHLLRNGSADASSVVITKRHPKTKLDKSAKERLRRAIINDNFEKLRLNIPHLKDHRNARKDDILLGAIILCDLDIYFF